MTEFIPGNALSNKELWLEDLKFLKNQNFNIPSFVWKAVENQAIDLLEKEYFWKTKRNIEFNNKKYRSFDDLVAEYRSKSEEAINYNGCKQNKKQLDETMEKYLKLGIIKFATPEQEKIAVINPLNCLETRPGKFSVILHTLINSMYRKMQLQLMDVCQRGNILKDIKKLRSEDLVSCYSEFKIRNIFWTYHRSIIEKPK